MVGTDHFSKENEFMTQTELPPRVDLPLEHDGGARADSGKWLVLLAAFLGWMFDGLEMGIFPQIAKASLGQLVPGADQKTINSWHGIIDAAFLFGAAAGGLVFGWLGDRIGRVRAMA